MNSPVERPSLWDRHKIFEKNAIILLIGIFFVVSIGALVEIVPLFYLKSTTEKVAGVRPYTPLELAGFDIFVANGCYLCHSQMVRPLRDEVERYGHYSLAAESMYDHPFQWGSERTGPDLARVGGKYSDFWHRDHLRNPRAVVPASIMPGFPWLEKTPLNAKHIADHMRVLAMEGVPYTPEMIENADKDLQAQGTKGEAGSAAEAAAAALKKRYPDAITRDLHADKGQLTEADALVTYLQQIGTHVDFTIYNDKANIR